METLWHGGRAPENRKVGGSTPPLATVCTRMVTCSLEAFRLDPLGRSHDSGSCLMHAPLPVEFLDQDLVTACPSTSRFSRRDVGASEVRINLYWQGVDPPETQTLLDKGVPGEIRQTRTRLGIDGPHPTSYGCDWQGARFEDPRAN